MGTAKMIRGKCIKFGDSINTDVIMPGRYLVTIDPKELAEHAFEPLGPEVQARLKTSAIIVAGVNFGCGSAREQAASGLLGVGIKAVIAKSFARTFFRNCINTGLLAVECPDAVDAIPDGGEVSIDTAAGTVTVENGVFRFAAYPESLQRILDAGGLIPYLAKYVLPERR
jgi:3-isopropylmalate dehydratase small subunit